MGKDPLEFVRGLRAPFAQYLARIRDLKNEIEELQEEVQEWMATQRLAGDTRHMLEALKRELRDLGRLSQAMTYTIFAAAGAHLLESRPSPEDEDASES